MATSGIDPRDFGLTVRRLQVLQAYADGGTRQTIAAALGVSQGAIGMHLVRCVTALRAKNAMHAVAEAIRKELIE